MRFHSPVAVAAIAAAVLCVPPVLSGQETKDDAADAARLVDVLAIHTGSTVADIGAGSGGLAQRIAQTVGREGHVYATEVNTQRLGDLRNLARGTDPNIVVVEGAAAQSNLPDGCCDAIYMRHVYHHFGEPGPMNASLYRALKPGGKLAVIDFTPKTGKSAPAGQRASGDAHGVMQQTVIDELSAAGFTNTHAAEWPASGSFLVVGERP